MHLALISGDGVRETFILLICFLLFLNFQAGDEILEVNGRRFTEVTHDEAVRILKYHERLVMKVRVVGKVPHSSSSLERSSKTSSGSAASTIASLWSPKENPGPGSPASSTHAQNGGHLLGSSVMNPEAGAAAAAAGRDSNKCGGESWNRDGSVDRANARNLQKQQQQQQHHRLHYHHKHVPNSNNASPLHHMNSSPTSAPSVVNGALIMHSGGASCRLQQSAKQQQKQEQKEQQQPLFHQQYEAASRQIISNLGQKR